MRGSERTKVGPALIVLAAAGGLGACNTASPVLTTGSIPDRKPPMVVSDAERDCLGRAMYFESNRSDSDGDRKSTRLNSSHSGESRMPSSA